LERPGEVLCGPGELAELELDDPEVAGDVVRLLERPRLPELVLRLSEAARAVGGGALREQLVGATRRRGGSRGRTRAGLGGCAKVCALVKSAATAKTVGRSRCMGVDLIGLSAASCRGTDRGQRSALAVLQAPPSWAGKEAAPRGDHSALAIPNRD
jgi:hypothetical protein